MLPVIKKILYATDLSECARHAIGYAVAMGRAHQAEVTVLTVLPDVLGDMSEAAGLDLESHFEEGQLEEFRRAALEKARKELHARITETAKAIAAESFGEPGFAPAEILVEPGDPARRILEQSAGYDLIVMGTHGKSGFLGRLMGSVAERVVRQSTVPVLVVRLPEPEREED